jgi:hypothetical protein
MVVLDADRRTWMIRAAAFAAVVHEEAKAAEEQAARQNR